MLRAARPFCRSRGVHFVHETSNHAIIKEPVRREGALPWEYQRGAHVPGRVRMMQGHVRSWGALGS